VAEVLIVGEHRQVVADAELTEQRVDRPDLTAQATSMGAAARSGMSRNSVSPASRRLPILR
jgi:hypothetical protein